LWGGRLIAIFEEKVNVNFYGKMVRKGKIVVYFALILWD